MSESNETPKAKATMFDDLLDYITQAIDEADEAAAVARVTQLREDQPDLTDDELADWLIRKKCFQAGAVGSITSGASVLPGIGTFVALTFGVAADIGLTFKMQAELVLELAAVYERDLTETERRSAVIAVTGMTTGANRLAGKAGEELARKASERLATKAMSKAIPFIGVATAGGTNMLTTYVIGQRAKAYFELGPEEMGDWGENVRALTGVDERKMIAWMSDSTETAWQLVSETAQDATEAVITAGKSAGELVVVGASKTSQTARSAGQWAGTGVVAGVKKAGQAVSETGRSLVDGMRNATERVTQAGQRARGKLGSKAEEAESDEPEQVDSASVE